MNVQQVLRYFPPGYVRDDIAAARAAGDLGRLWRYFTFYRRQDNPPVCRAISAALLENIHGLIRVPGETCAWSRLPGMDRRDLTRLWSEADEFRRQPGIDGRIIRLLYREIYDLAQERKDDFYRNRALNELEIIDGKTVLASQPRLMHVSLTARCNMRCAFCAQGQSKKPWDLPDHICDEVIGCLPYLQHVRWQGGEAFLHPRFREMVSEAVRYPQLMQTVITNGMFLDESWVALFAKSRQTVLSLPMESLNPALYNSIRRGGDLARLQKGIELVAAARRSGADIIMSLNLVAIRSNYREIEAVIDYAIDHAFLHVVLTPLYYEQESAEFYAREYISPDDPEVREVMLPALARIRAKTRGTHFMINDRFLGTNRDCGAPDGTSEKKDEPKAEPAPAPAAETVPPAPSPACQCRAPWQQMTLDMSVVRPFCYCTHSVGDISGARLQDIWNGPAMQELRADILRGDVRSCNAVCLQGIINRNDTVMD